MAPDLRNVIPFCLALVEAGCAEATWDKLLTSLPPIRINQSLLMWDDEVRKLFSGHVVVVKKPDNSQAECTSPESLTPEEWLVAEEFPLDSDDDPTILMRVYRSAGATEERIRRSLGISSMLLARVTASLWNRTFSQERDRRAGVGANAQKRGQVTRQMQAELKEAIKGVQDGDGQ